MALATFLTKSCAYSFPYWTCNAKASFWYSKTTFFDDFEPLEHKYGERITINVLPSCRAQKKNWNVGTHHISIDLISLASWYLVDDDKTDVCTILMYFVNLFHMKIMTMKTWLGPLLKILFTKNTTWGGANNPFAECWLSTTTKRQEGDSAH